VTLVQKRRVELLRLDLTKSLHRSSSAPPDSPDLEEHFTDDISEVADPAAAAEIWPQSPE